MLTGLNGHIFTGRDHSLHEITGRVTDYFDGYLLLEVNDPAGAYRILRRICDCVDGWRFLPPAAR